MTIRSTIALLALALSVAAPARAHVVYGTPSLHELARDADLVVRVRVATSERMLHTEAGRRPVVDAMVLETLHGEPMQRVTFAPHGHGAAAYHDGEEALVFLRRLERLPELATTPLAGRVSWVSVQETTDKIALGPRTRHVWLDATRRYLRAQTLPDPAARRTALRETTIALLGSPSPRVAASALRALVVVGDGFGLGADDRPRLEALIGRASIPIAVRVGLLAELERRGVVVGPPLWARLLRGARGADLRRVVRAAGAHPSPEVTAALVQIAGAADIEAAAEAAVSLGVPGHDDAVAPLGRLLAGGDQRLRFAAIRGLGRIGTAPAMEALRHAAAFSADAATRRRAGAEVVVLERSRATVASRPPLQ